MTEWFQLAVTKIGFMKTHKLTIKELLIFTVSAFVLSAAGWFIGMYVSSLFGPQLDWTITVGIIVVFEMAFIIPFVMHNYKKREREMEQRMLP